MAMSAKDHKVSVPQDAALGYRNASCNTSVRIRYARGVPAPRRKRSLGGGWPLGAGNANPEREAAHGFAPWKPALIYLARPLSCFGGVIGQEPAISRKSKLTVSKLILSLSSWHQGLKSCAGSQGWCLRPKRPENVRSSFGGWWLGCAIAAPTIRGRCPTGPPRSG